MGVGSKEKARRVRVATFGSGAGRDEAGRMGPETSGASLFLRLVSKEVDEGSTRPGRKWQQLVLERVHLRKESRSDKGGAEEWHNGKEEGV